MSTEIMDNKSGENKLGAKKRQPPILLNVKPSLIPSEYPKSATISNVVKLLGWKQKGIPRKYLESIEYQNNEENNTQGTANTLNHIPGLRFTVAWVPACTTDFYRHLKPHQSVNQIPGIEQLSCKKFLAFNLNKVSRAFPEEYNFFPKTWVLPHDWHAFMSYEASKSTKKSSKRTYIAKPHSSCEGKGIYLFNSLDMIDPKEKVVVQRYVRNPMLIDGCKFDLRLYVLITSISPLKIYWFENGLVRICTEKYRKPTKRTLDNTCMHLTNYAINKHHPDFVYNTNTRDSCEGNKWTLKGLIAQLKDRGIDTDSIIKAIKALLVKTIMSVKPELTRRHELVFGKNASAKCFQFLGFDVLLDEKMRPWLLEVNRNPSLACESNLDSFIKLAAIKKTLEMVYQGSRKKGCPSEETNRSCAENAVPANIPIDTSNWEVLFDSTEAGPANNHKGDMVTQTAQHQLLQTIEKWWQESGVQRSRSRISTGSNTPAPKGKPEAGRNDVVKKFTPSRQNNRPITSRALPTKRAPALYMAPRSAAAVGRGKITVKRVFTVARRHNVTNRVPSLHQGFRL